MASLTRFRASLYTVAGSPRRPHLIRRLRRITRLEFYETVRGKREVEVPSPRTCLLPCLATPSRTRRAFPRRPKAAPPSFFACRLRLASFTRISALLVQRVDRGTPYALWMRKSALAAGRRAVASGRSE